MHLSLKIMTVMLPFFDLGIDGVMPIPANAILTEDNLALLDESGIPLLTE